MTPQNSEIRKGNSLAWWCARSRSPARRSRSRWPFKSHRSHLLLGPPPPLAFSPLSSPSTRYRSVRSLRIDRSFVARREIYATTDLGVDDDGVENALGKNIDRPHRIVSSSYLTLFTIIGPRPPSEALFAAMASLAAERIIVCTAAPTSTFPLFQGCRFDGNEKRRRSTKLIQDVTFAARIVKTDYL